ncbi:MAG: hypothetical protein AAGA31_11805 [Bacteroidota bacterium]
MRTLLLFAICALFVACSTPKKSTASTSTPSATSTEGYEPPTDLEGPAYDPATSPQPMTASTALPKPPGYEAPTASEQPASYGSVPADPNAYPSANGENATPMAAKGKEAAPFTYSNGVAMPPSGEAATIAAQLAGLWVNSVDEKEIVEFTIDHYSTFYNGELLLQEAMTYHAQCPGDCNGGAPMEIACFTISGPAGTDCYGILRVTQDLLELSMLGVSTEAIVYYRHQN